MDRNSQCIATLTLYDSRYCSSWKSLCVAHVYHDSLEYLQPLELGVDMHLIESTASRILPMLKKSWH